MPVRPALKVSGGELGQQPLNPLVDLAAHGFHVVEGALGGVGQGPVLVVLVRVDGSSITASHGDDHVGRSDDVVRQRLGVAHLMSTPTLAIAPTT